MVSYRFFWSEQKSYDPTSDLAVLGHLLPREKALRPLRGVKNAFSFIVMHEMRVDCEIACGRGNLFSFLAHPFIKRDVILHEV